MTSGIETLNTSVQQNFASSEELVAFAEELLLQAKSLDSSMSDVKE